eukprot:scaffold3471_cov87-Attheya_sp.AAC.5
MGGRLTSVMYPGFKIYLVSLVAGERREKREERREKREREVHLMRTNHMEEAAGFVVMQFTVGGDYVYEWSSATSKLLITVPQ